MTCCALDFRVFVNVGILDWGMNELCRSTVPVSDWKYYLLMWVVQLQNQR